MTKIYQRPIQDLAGLTYPCSCGRTHQVDIQAIRVGSGCLKELPNILRQLGASRVFLLADNYTFEAAGRQVEELLQQAQIPYHSRLFQTTTPLVPNEYALGSALVAMETRGVVV